jgi:hypothetical protein
MSVWGNIRELHGRILTHSCTAITELLVSLPLRELYFPPRLLQGVWSGRFDRSRKFDHCRHCIIEHFGADRLAGHLNRSHASTLLASQTNQCAILQSNKVYDNDAMMSRPYRLI